MIEGAVFDLDGTLLDSMFVWQSVGAEYLRSQGKIPVEDQARVFKALTLEQAAEYEKVHYCLPQSVQEIMNGINALVENCYFHQVRLRPGAAEFLKKLRDRNIPMAIATATDRYLTEAALKRCGVLDCFAGIFTCTEIGKGKERPDIYIAAQMAMGTGRQHTWVFEDAIHGASTAFSAGFSVVGIRDASEEDQKSLQQVSTVYLRDFREDEAFWKKALE